jgi:3-dehydroquinate synthetase
MGLGGIRNGEAVAIGMKVALSLSRKVRGLEEAQYKRALAVLERIPVPDVWLDQDLERFLNRDKKRVSGRVRCVLLEDIGRSLVTVLDDPGELLRVL